MLGRTIDLLMPLPLYLLALLGWLGLRSFRPRPAPWPGRRARLPLLVLTAWVWVVTMPATGHALHRWLEGPIERPAERPVARDPGTLIVVLASGQMRDGDGTLHPRLDVHGWERTVGAIELWKRSGGTLVFAGGAGDTHATSLAGAMRRVALDMGVPQDAIRTATGSTNTREDLLQAQALLAGAAAGVDGNVEAGEAAAGEDIALAPVRPARTADAAAPRERPRAGPGTGPVWLVTSALHMPRSLAVARRIGLEVQPFPVDYRQIHGFTWKAWIPNNGAPARVAAALHEIVGRLAYRLKGWSD